jgi:hypothetical protein
MGRCHIYRLLAIHSITVAVANVVVDPVLNVWRPVSVSAAVAQSSQASGVEATLSESHNTDSAKLFIMCKILLCNL